MMRLSLVYLFAAWVVIGCATSAAAQPGPVLAAEDVAAIQDEPQGPTTGRYDWGPSVMLDRGLYRMWWTRLGGRNQKRFPYATTLPNGERFEFTYPDRGDRIYYAESRDGRTWHIEGDDYAGRPEDFGPDAKGPLLVLSPAESPHERMHLGCASVVRIAGIFHLYYEACSEFIVKRGPDGKPTVGDEYHNQIFLATSKDGKKWERYPSEREHRPILTAPAANKQPGRQRYGFGQPSVCWKDGRFILHYVDSCSGPGDFIIRLEADNPHFRNPRVFRRSLADVGAERCPPGAVARFAQIDVKYLGDTWLLTGPAYGTGNVNLLTSRDGLFATEAAARSPAEVFPQVRLPDPRGQDYRTRLYPRFLTDPAGQIVTQNGKLVLYYTSGRGFKDQAHTWDLFRAEVAKPRGLK